MVTPKRHFAEFKRKMKVPSARIGQRLRLGRNERTLPFSQEVLQAMLAQISGEDLVAYPEIEPLYEQLGAWVGVARDHLLLFNGSEDAIKTIFELYVEVGDEVVLPYPAYYGYTRLSRLYGGVIRKIRCDAHLRLPSAAFLAAITPATKLIILGNPDATGTALDFDFLQQVLQQAQAVEALVLVDEAYYHFHQETAVSLLAAHQNLIVTRSFSKALGAAGVRIGLTVAHPEITQELYKLKLNYEISAPAVKIGQYLLSHPQIMHTYIDEMRQGQQQLTQALTQRGLCVHPTVANFILIQLPAALDPADFVDYCHLEANIEVTGRFREPLEQYIRLTLGPWAQMKQFVQAADRYLNYKNKVEESHETT